MSLLETKDLIEDRISAPIQSDTTKIKYPCTGFCYLGVLKKDKIVETYYKTLNNENDIEYFKLIHDLIVVAGKRKEGNVNICEDGEYIDADTIKAEFKSIVNNMKFEEFGTVNDSYGDIAINNIAMILFETPILGHLIINRSNETFLLVKLFDDIFLLVDSHQPFHGKLSFENCTKYITKFNNYEGTIQIGSSINHYNF